ncbi:hypothetical protein BSLG_005129 [Batrachochytrium salamandrivorans]|nr:hypothetical protein BSLG_005129 [Batrachochytrium salamandrivorans]
MSASSGQEPPLLKSRRPCPSVTAKCPACSAIIEFSVPEAASNYPFQMYRVECFSCKETVLIPTSSVTASARQQVPTSTSVLVLLLLPVAVLVKPAVVPSLFLLVAKQSLLHMERLDQIMRNAKTVLISPFYTFIPDDNPVDMEYYDLLEIPANASNGAIKKAYYLKAMKYHPDKNLDNPLAEEQFKLISEAYQVLSDPQRRTFYNIHGKEAAAGSEGAVFVDPEKFFRQQFGGDMFVDIIGEISIARDFKEVMASKDGTKAKDGSTVSDGVSSAGADGVSGQPSASTAAKSDSAISYELRMQIRRERIHKLSQNLVTKLSLYTDAFPLPDPVSSPPLGTSLDTLASEALSTFRTLSTIEAQQLSSESYGVELLRAIGFTYVLKADQWIAKIAAEDGGAILWHRVWGLGSRVSGAIKEKTHIINETVGTFRTALDLQSKFTKLQEMDKKTKKNDGDKNDRDASGGDANDDNGQVELTPEEQELRSKLEYEAATKGLEALWRGSKLEVESVLRDVCDDALGDAPGVSTELRKRRATALRILGQAYEDVGTALTAVGGAASLPPQPPLPPRK